MGKKKLAAEPSRIEFETFQSMQYVLHNLTQDKPSCFNGMVRFRKRRVIIELVDESIEALTARLLKMWRETDNTHEWEPLKKAAASIGVELPQNQLGKDRKKN